MIIDYLQGRKVVIEKIQNNQENEEWHQNRGVPAGGVLSPLLFKMYIDQVLHHVNNIKIQSQFKLLGYSDDLILIMDTETNNMHNFTQDIKTMYKEVKESLKKVKLSINDNKTRVMATNSSTDIFHACLDVGFELESHMVITGYRITNQNQPLKEHIQQVIENTVKEAMLIRTGTKYSKTIRMKQIQVVKAELFSKIQTCARYID